MNECGVLLLGNRRHRKRNSSSLITNSGTEIRRHGDSSPAFRSRHSSEKQVGPKSHFPSKNVLGDFGCGEGPCRGGKVEDEPMEGAGASSLPPEGGEGKKSSGGAEGSGAPEGNGGGGGAAEASGGGRSSVGGDGGGKRPPHHRGVKKALPSGSVSGSTTEDEFDLAAPSSSVLLPEKRDKWWLHKREFSFHHFGTKMRRSKKRRGKHKRVKSKVRNSEEADALGYPRLPQQSPKQKVRKRWAAAVNKVNAVARFSISGDTRSKRKVVLTDEEAPKTLKRRMTPPPKILVQPEKEPPILLNEKEEVSPSEEVLRMFEEREAEELEEELEEPEEEEPMKEQWEFSDSEITSDDEKENLSAADDVEGQLDSEWLLHCEDPPSHVAKRQTKLNESSSLLPAGKELSKNPKEPDFLSVMLPLYRVMSLCGRFPFKIVRSADGSAPQFQFVRKSKEYAACVVSFFLFGLSSTYMTYNLLSIYLEPPPYTIYNHVLAIEFDKFWAEGVVLMLWFYFHAISNAALLIRGNNVAEFLTRWLEALTLIRYNATRGIRRFLVIIFLILILLVFYNVGDFVVEWGHIRGSRGIIGLLIIDQFQNRVRLSLVKYRFAECLGLLVEVYYFFCTVSTLALISTHAWAIDNAARRFNLRLGFSLGILKAEDVPFELRKMVPWKKLFAEHLVVTSLPKMLGKTFFVTLNVFFAFLVCLMVMSLYGLFSTVLLATPESDNDTEYYNVSGMTNLRDGDFVPVKNRLSPIVSVSKEVYSVGLIWMVGFVFLELLNRPGSTIMGGARFVFRKGYVDCRSLFERRFVASMMFSYAPRVPAGVRPGFPIDRVFISKFLTFAFGVFMIFIQFCPQQLQRDTKLICDVFGSCQLIAISRVARTKPAYAWHLLSDVAQQKKRKKPPVTTTTTRAPPLPPLESTEVLLFPPCNSEGRRPKGWPEFATEIQCDGSKASPVYQPSLFQLTNGRYSRLAVDCGENSVAPPPGDTYDCFGEIVDLNVTDECGNHFIPTPDLLGDSRNPGMQVSVLEVGGSKGPQVFCCFVYEQLETQAEVCNLPEGSRGRCRKTQTGLEAMEASFVELWRSSGGAVDLTIRRKWALCLCQGTGGVGYSKQACDYIDKPIPRSCSAIEVRQKMCDCENEGDNRDVFTNSPLHSECPDVRPKYNFLAWRHLRLGLVEVVEGRTEGIVYAHGLELLGSCPIRKREAPYPRYPPAGSKSTLYDCFGEIVSPVSFKDDCGNPRIAFPNSKGERTLPQLRAKEESRVTDNATNPNITDVFFVCCWDYRSIHTDVAKKRDGDDHDHQEICSNLRSLVSGACAVRTKRVEYVADDIGDDQNFIEECGEQIFRTVDYDKNVNWRFLEKCEVNAPKPCNNDP